MGIPSITADVYPNQSGSKGTWFFLNNVEGVSDRLVQDTSTNLYQTEHISRLRVVKDSGCSTKTCFRVWDPSGLYYEFGDSNDSLQYRTDSTGATHYYRWDLTRVIAPNEGPNGKFTIINFLYGQDSTTDNNGHVTIRDAVIKQITYGTQPVFTDSGTFVPVGTVDFSYLAPFTSSPWATQYQYGGSHPNYACSSNPPASTSLRCDDPIDMPGSDPAPAVMSTMLLQTLTSYVGSDSSGNTAYSYAFTYSDIPFSSCKDINLNNQYCAGEHVLTSVTPSVFQSGTAHSLKPVVFGYGGRWSDTYYDSQHTIGGTSQKYGGQTYWQYLTSYLDTQTGQGANISYLPAYNNTHGTTYFYDSHGNLEDRYDPTYCFQFGCSGAYAHPDELAWSMQIVTQIASWGTDSSATSLHPAVTSYSYRLAKTGTYHAGGFYCAPGTGPSPTPPDNNDCVGDTWMPPNENDWADYYHGEYHGFAAVYITSPAGNLTVDSYNSTDGWNHPETDAVNYNSGQLTEEDVYNGNQAVANALLRQTINTYPTDPGNPACMPSSHLPSGAIYIPCESMLLNSKTIQVEGGNPSSGPWTQDAYTYDDYDSTGFHLGKYHNVLSDVRTNANSSGDAAQITGSWVYNTTDQADSSNKEWWYYNVDKVKQSKTTDATGHVWGCQSITYDEGVPNTVPTPSAGWPTTFSASSDCTNQSGTAITAYTGYDAYGNPVASVDGVGTANASLYSSAGCTLSSPPSIMSANWSAQHYTTCSSYDSTETQPVQGMDALGHSSTTTYDPAQGELPIHTHDVDNNTTTSTSYTYDANSGTNGKVTIGIALPQADGSSGSVTNQTSSFSACPTTLPSSSTVLLPCLESDSNATLYSTAITRTYYDSLGRAIETLTPVPTPVNGDSNTSYVNVVFTVYNDAQNSVFQSLPFTVVSQQNGQGTWWVDPAPNGNPNNLVDYQNQPVGGTATYADALGRQLAIKDPLFNANQNNGITCPSLNSRATTCTLYGLGSVTTNPPDSNTYASTEVLDANDHAAVSFADALGRTVYVQSYSGVGVVTLNNQVNALKAIQYNVLNEPTSVTQTDLLPQPNQVTTSVTATAQYDDLGRVTKVTDPDRGIEKYSYDADGRVISDVSSPLNSPHSRTLGYIYDLLGRLGCVQDITPSSPSPNTTGACTGGNPYVQNTYDTSTLALNGTTDFPVGQLTKSISTTYFPDSSTPSAPTATVTTLAEHDARGRLIGSQLQLGLQSSGWNPSTPLPTYQLALSYNDANQLTNSTTSTLPSGQGYTMAPVYDSATGVQTGLSDGTHILASQVANTYGMLDTLTLYNASGSALITKQASYDGDVRPSGETACWVSSGCGGTNGTIFRQSRTFDNASNVTSVSTTLAAVPGLQPGGSETQNFCYDEQDRLLWAGNTGTQPAAGNGTCGSGTLSSGFSGASYNKSYSYTHLGQLWQVTDNVANSISQYLYCDSVHPHQLSGIYTPPAGQSSTCSNTGSAQYTSTYKDSSNNDWGNIYQRTVGGSTATLNMDHINHLSFWDTGSASTGQEWYVYDAAGNRVLRRSTSGGSTTLTVYAFGMQDLTYGGDGTPQSSLSYYALGGSLLGAQLQSGGSTTTHFFLTDGLGSIVATVSRASKAVEGEQLYDPYGTSRYAPGTRDTAKGFTGQYADSLTGLDYYNARYYDPAAGRFASADTVQGNLHGMDPYAYVGDNPETATDPSGMRIQQCGFKCQYWGTKNLLHGTHGYGHYGYGRGGGSQRCGWRCQYGGDNWLGAVGRDIADAASWVLDALGGLVSMAHDVHVLFNGRVGLGGKLRAGLDFGINVAIDALSLGEFSAEADLALHEGEALAHDGEEALLGGEAALSQGACSFTPTTVVTTAHGKQAIGKLHVGDKVLAYNSKTHTMELEPILHVWMHTDNDLVNLTITTTVRTRTAHGIVMMQQREVIHTNQKHPFFTVEKGFLPVAHLKLGMHILQADGHLGLLTGWRMVPGIQVMYNLEVARDHTFTVGVGEWVVHNCGSRPYDVVPYKPKNPPFENHHGIMDVWAEKNITGYDGDRAPTVVLTNGQHNATRSVFAYWRNEWTGSFWGRVDWYNVSASEIYSLSERMFDAASVPVESRQAYYRAFYEFVYTGSFTPYNYR